MNHISHIDPITLGLAALRARPAGPLPRQGRALPHAGHQVHRPRRPADPGLPADRRRGEGVRGRGRRRPRRAPASASTPRARSPRTPAVGRCAARPVQPGSPWRPAARSSRSASGARRRSCRRTRCAPHAVPATHRALQGRRPGRSERPDGQAAHQRGAARGHRADHGRDHRLVADLRGETPPAVRFDPRARASGEIGNPNKDAPARTRSGGVRDGPGRSVQRGVVGDRLRARARRRGQRRHRLGAGATTCAPTSTTSTRTPTTSPASSCPRECVPRTNPDEALDGAEFVVLSVPSQCLRDNLTGWAPLMSDDVTFISLMKGVELDTTKRMSQVIAEVTGAGPERIAVVSGPNLAPRDRPARARGQRRRLRRRGRRAPAPGRCATPGRSGPTGAPTCSAASSAAPTRTSSDSASAWPSGSASVTTPPRR